jgi:predicted DNA-binding transcriptional regulator YafY
MEPKHSLPDAQEHYHRVLEAIGKRRKIRLNYNSVFDGDEICTLVSPYQMLFHKHTWYVIGRSSVHKEVRTFHVGRILASTLTEDAYEIPPRFSLKKYFGNAWQMIREEVEVEVVVQFNPLVARNVSEVLWHPTQRLVWNPDGSLNFHATVAGIREISWWVLGYGDQAEVLAPRSLRELIIAHIQQMVSMYHAPLEAVEGNSKSKKSASKKAVKSKRPTTLARGRQ